jgi:hypothetical protein
MRRQDGRIPGGHLANPFQRFISDNVLWRFCKSSGGGPLGPPPWTHSLHSAPAVRPLWEQRAIITSCWSAPGSNRRPPAVLLRTAVRSGPAFVDGDWIGASGRTLAASAPIREYGFLPHVGRDPLLLNGPTVAARWCAFVGIGWSTVEGVFTVGTTCTTRLWTEPAVAKAFNRFFHNRS